MPTSRNGSKYDFYVSTTITEENSKCRYKVVSKAKLKVKVYRFKTAYGGTVIVSNGSTGKGNIDNKYYGNSKSELVYTLATATHYYEFSKKDRIIKISAKSYNDISSGGYGPGKLSYNATKTLKAKFSSNATLSVKSSNQTKITMSLKLPKATYTRVVKWYIGDKLHDTITYKKTTTDITHTYAKLLPNKTYNITAKIYAKDDNSTDPLLTTRSLSVTTPKETCTLQLTPFTTYIRCNLTGMFDNPTYNRTIKLYYKVKDDWVLYNTYERNSSAAELYVKGLISNQKHSIKVEVCNGKTIYLTKIESATTLKDESLVPEGIIDSLTQKLGTREITMKWSSNKKVSGTTYYIECKEKNESNWQTLKTLSEIESPIILNSPKGNTNMEFRIRSKNISVAGTEKISQIETIYVRDDFVWDIPKEIGRAFEVTANEWNRLGDYVVAKHLDNGKKIVIKRVKKGDVLSSVIYNDMKNHINVLTPLNIVDKKPGEAINMADIDKLREGINKA